MANSSWQAGEVQANGLRLHYTRTGGAKPPLVLAHGFSDDGLCWTPVAEQLEAAYDVIMVDARGHGLSEAPKGSFGPLEQADDLAGVITGLGLGQPAVLGHSMGAVSTLILAGRHPSLPGRVILEDPPPWWASDATPAYTEAWREQSRAWLAPLQNKSREAIIAGQREAAPLWAEAELGPWADSKLRFNLAFLDQAVPSDIHWPTLLKNITCPALLLTANTQRGSAVSAQQAAALQAQVPQLRVELIAEAGHNIRREQFKSYMEAVQTFLAETAKAG